ncbi:MAG: hypothetical protein LWY06_01415 [Firmicutes bacterium]|nr:hypothetical protein [Bacillota bacterium]
MTKKILIIITISVALVLTSIYFFRYELVFELFSRFGSQQVLTHNKKIDDFVLEKLESIFASDPKGFKTTLFKHFIEDDKNKSEAAKNILLFMVKLPASEYIKLYKDDYPVEKRMSLINMMNPTEADTKNFITEKLNIQDTDPKIKSICLLHLIAVDDKKTTDSCLRFLNDPNPEVRRVAVILFADTNKGEYTSALIKKMYDENGEVNFIAAMRLYDFDQTVKVENYKKYLTAEKPLNAMFAIYVAMNRNDKTDIPVLKKLRDSSPNDDIRKMAAFALKNMETKH